MWQHNPTEKISSVHRGLTRVVERVGDEHISTEFTGVVRCMDNSLGKPSSVRAPQVWAVWNDLFHEDVPDEFIVDALGQMQHVERHLFLVLTKRISRAHRFLQQSIVRIPSNMWLGVTVESQEYAWRAERLLEINGISKKFVSMEPLLGPVSGEWIEHLDWVVVGGESGANARPMHPEWVHHIVARPVFRFGLSSGVNGLRCAHLVMVSRR
jgi:protein gp37